jgi:plastocyanin
MSRLSFRTIFAILVLVSAFVVVGAAGEAAVAAGPELTEVKIDNFSFTPQTITVAGGTQVRWTNHDDLPHTVVSEDKIFKSKVLDTDDQFTYTFTKPGTYKCFCSLHPRMTAIVVVQ